MNIIFTNTKTNKKTIIKNVSKEDKKDWSNYLSFKKFPFFIEKKIK